MCCKHCINLFRMNTGLLLEVKMAALEAKGSLPADFSDRAAAAAALPDGPQKDQAVFALYEEVQQSPITEERVQDPVPMDKIVDWSPCVLSPFTYDEQPERFARNARAAYTKLETCGQSKTIAFVRDFVKHKGFTFTQQDVLDWLIAHEDALPSSAMMIAVMNARAGLGTDRTASFANPYRGDSDSLAVGAVFGIELAGKPDLAARAAMTFASVMFLKNGVYAAMWMASLLSHAAVITDPEVYVVRALNSVPIPSVFFRKTSWMQRNLNCQVTWEDCRDEICSKWSDNDNTFACRSALTNSLAIAAALLYTKSDPQKATEYVQECGLQKEINAAYIYAVLQMLK